PSIRAAARARRPTRSARPSTNRRTPQSPFAPPANRDLRGGFTSPRFARYPRFLTMPSSEDRERFAMGSQLRRVYLGAVGDFPPAGWDRTTAQEHVARAQQFAAADNPRSAIIEFKNALQKDPNLAAARLGLGETELSVGDVQSAEKELERALDLGADK